MKGINSKLLLLLLSCSISSYVFPAPLQKPIQCPSPDFLKRQLVLKEDFYEIEPPKEKCCDANGFPYKVDGKWGIKEYEGSYGTENKWSFGLHTFTANNYEQAFSAVVRTIFSLRFYSGPVQYMGRWYCTYLSENGDVSTTLID
ncbi:MAG: hypothetical protein ACYCQI_07795 [Gammaproteobacteria bacterium]